MCILKFECPFYYQLMGHKNAGYAANSVDPDQTMFCGI